MRIVIITRGRVGNLHTLKSIPWEWQNDTVILCPENEVEQHERLHPDILVMSEGQETLNYSQKFHNIVNGVYHELGRKLLIMDDDLRFSKREGKSLITATPADINLGLLKLDTLMDDYPLVGLHPRAMGNNAPEGIKECTRINAMQGVNIDKIGPLKLDHWPILADMVLNLSLLTRGDKTAIWCDLFWDQVGASNAPGGCSLHRTAEQQAEAVLGLKAMFPEYVTVKEKEVKKGWFGGKRLDFVVQWKRAYEGSKR